MSAVLPSRDRSLPHTPDSSVGFSDVRCAEQSPDSRDAVNSNSLTVPSPPRFSLSCGGSNQGAAKWSQALESRILELRPRNICGHLCMSCCTLWNRERKMEEVQLLGYLISRFEFHARTFQLSTFSASRDTEISGPWQVLHVLHQMHNEFRLAPEFLQDLMRYFERDVEWMMGPIIDEAKYGTCHAPWTERGKRLMSLFVEHLAEMNSDVHGLPRALGESGVLSTMVEALEVLRAESGQKKVAIRTSVWPEEHVAELKVAVRKRMLKANSSNEWFQKGLLPRAFAIGLADLWKLEDYKALSYILKQAIRIRGPSPSKAEEAIFGWVHIPITLAGPHLAKFAGDSDSIAEFTARLFVIRDVALPAFSLQLVRMKAIMDVQISQVTLFMIKMLASVVVVAGLIGSAIMRNREIMK